MYDDKLYEDYDFLQKHCSPELLKKLQDAYPYDSDGVAYATWLFRSGQQDSKPGSDDKTMMLDVKAVETQWSDTLISYPRDRVLKNLDYLLSVGKLYEVRTIIFPGRDRDNEATVRYVAEHIGDGCFYKIIRYRPYGVRERYQTYVKTRFGWNDAQLARLARDLGASKAYVV